MTTNRREKSLVVIQLTGGNDYLNTVVPHGSGMYYDSRPVVRIDQDKVLPINDQIGFAPALAPIKELWDKGNVAVINGIGYFNPNRSHFRSMDIWHTAEPDAIGTEGWLGRTTRDLDPHGENVLTTIHFGRGLPRALGCRGVPVASVGDLQTYGLYPDLEDDPLRDATLECFSQMYSGAVGRGAVLDYIGQTGSDALKGADILRTAPAMYSSSVEYGPDGLSQSMKSMAQVMFADLGTRIYYTTHGGYDTHSGELDTHAKLWDSVSRGVSDFMADLTEHGRQDDAVVLIFSEFGRRIKDNGSGSDHGSGGVAFLIGNSVNGGLYGEYPSLEEKDQLEGDLRANNDFRSTYTALLEQCLELDAAPIVNGRFEPFDLIRR